ncbi:meiotic recombination protein REC114 isoform X2 [Sphaerodactylus townsendi]|uniref:meiotic recombination protein REC114 isoform X2 n=1 Tax=Sphaerodactylus townsendi TaxID=933632 RepID=UPI0020271448|nr:meiotic recombination protein REC114 isoform X2 [Sphaerodactylus townsendi]
MATCSDESHACLTSCSEAPVTEVPATERSRDSSSCLRVSEWPLKRYGRFMPGALATASGSWKVLESDEESGVLVLTIVISGHFFISRGKKVLEGFSLIDASKWLKIVRNADCMLFGSKIKNKHRMFRVQFAGDSKTQKEEHCYSCVQKLDEYVPVQVMDAARLELQQSHSQPLEDEDQVKDAEQNQPVQHTDLLKTNFALPLAYQQSAWSAEDLGSFIRLCLLDQNFPAFVEEVEKQLKKMTEG